MKALIKIIVLFFSDPDVKTGTAGAVMAVGIPLMKGLTIVFQFVGAFAGLILLYLSIRHKILEIKRIKQDGRDRKR